ncbi:Similar to phosphoglycolate phosphatase, clustered with ribosomal large subunit pseudouridine synthase C [hydrothermal vent metagenome]|uniref:Similar to phosphoglycolate phosphatase, clustered with ribosomal large subunit pseudouridine synthase C n=1 Tax=hydrothermal vent metagenome TaxID=652676 RepID=A0A3B1BB22_9ZZZZ
MNHKNIEIHQATQLIVFDWDGTLMDSEARIVDCMRASIEDLSLAPRTRQQMTEIIGLGLAEALAILYPEGTAAQHTALTDRYRYHFVEVNQTPSALFPGVETMLAELNAQGHFLAVATGKGRRGLDRVLEETNTGQYFHTTRCADESFSKPHPQMLQEIMDSLGVESNDTLMIGDTEYDLQMANNASVQSLAVSYGVHHLERLLNCNPLDCVDDISALRHWLQRKYKLAA